MLFIIEIYKIRIKLVKKIFKINTALHLYFLLGES
jgi:hypothetical protein